MPEESINKVFSQAQKRAQANVKTKQSDEHGTQYSVSAKVASSKWKPEEEFEDEDDPLEFLWSNPFKKQKNQKDDDDADDGEGANAGKVNTRNNRGSGSSGGQAGGGDGGGLRQHSNLGGGAGDGGVRGAGSSATIEVASPGTNYKERQKQSQALHSAKVAALEGQEVLSS